MKKILALLLALLMVAFAFFGCDSTKDETPSTNDSEQTPSGSNGSLDNSQNATDGNPIDGENDDTNNNQSNNLENIPNTWEPESENLIGLGIYLIKDNNLPFTDGQIIYPTMTNGVAKFKDFCTNYFTGYVFRALHPAVVSYDFVTDAEFYDISYHRDDDAINHIYPYIIIDDNTISKYVIGYVYNVDDEIFMKVDTKLCTVYDPSWYENPEWDADGNPILNENDVNCFSEISTTRIMVDGLNNQQFKDVEFEVEIRFHCSVSYNTAYNKLPTYESYIISCTYDDGEVVSNEYDVYNLPSEMIVNKDKKWTLIEIYGVTNGEKTRVANREPHWVSEDYFTISMMKDNISFLWRLDIIFS